MYNLVRSFFSFVLIMPTGFVYKVYEYEYGRSCVLPNRSTAQCVVTKSSLASFRLRDTHGWEHVFTSPYLDSPIEKIALNTKMPGTLGDKMVAVASGWY